MHIIACIGLVLLIVVVVFSMSLYFYHIAVKRADKSFLADNLDVDVEQIQEEISEVWEKRPRFDVITITSEDGLKLRSYWFQAIKPSIRLLSWLTVIRGKRMIWICLQKYYHEDLGYHVLMPDARGHGRSEGGFICFGWRERKDYVQWIRYLIDKWGPQSQIVLHGVSMGGATVCMTSGESLPYNVKAIISDCAYTSVHAQLAYQLKRMYKPQLFLYCIVRAC